MLNIGDLVRVMPPFEGVGEGVISEITTYEDGQVVYILGELGGFDAKYLELVQ